MNDDLSSEFEFDPDKCNRKRRRLDLSVKDSQQKTAAGNKDESQSAWNKEDRKRHFFSVDAYSRHKMLVNQYLLDQPGATKILKRDTSRDKTYTDIIRENHKFLWSDDDQASDWASKLAKRYYDKLYKEYCIADLSRYKEKMVAMRWRTEQEVISGKGQFICGNKKCEDTNDLTSWEVNFGYVENGEKKNALIKLRLCHSCSKKLNYYHQKKKAIKPQKRSNKTKTDELVSPDSEAIIADLTTHDTKSEIIGSDTFPSSSKTIDSDVDVWTKPSQIVEETDKNREEEFAEFLDELFV